MFGAYLFNIFSNANEHENSIQAIHKSTNERERSIQAIYENTEALKKDLPMKIDDVTTLEEVDFDGTTISYRSKVEISGLSDSEKQRLESAVIDGNGKIACETPDIVENLDMGIAYHYDQYDLDDIKIGSYTITKEFCDNL